jgi:glycolate oxidase iron-sulfur subunit
VQYGRLVDIGRKVVDERVERPIADRATRRALAEVVPRSGVFGSLLKLGQLVRPALPFGLQDKVPATENRPAGPWPAPRHARKMLVLAGCAQATMAPDINAAAARVLDRLGISLVEERGAGCCGALRFHLNYQEEGRGDMRAVIDAWWPRIQRGEIEAIVMTASGCGVVVKEYGHLLAHDPRYADKARRVAELTKDLAEIVAAELERLPQLRGPEQRVAFHAPCTLQHGQQIRGVVERILARVGCTLTPIADAHLCCGSAGTYSILQPELARELRTNKLAALLAGGPDVVATANIGCLTHLQAGSPLAVRHWVNVLDARMAAGTSAP